MSRIAVPFVLSCLVVTTSLLAQYPKTISRIGYPLLPVDSATDSVFTIAVIPDPQNYLAFDHQKAEGYPFDCADQFLSQMRFVAKNAESAGGDIAFVTCVGDVWNHQSILMDPAHQARGLQRDRNSLLQKHFPPTEKTRAYEMPMAKRAFEIIAGKVPFSVIPGNHDYDALWIDSRYPLKIRLLGKSEGGQSHVGGLDNFREVFGEQAPFFKGKSWYVESHDGGADSAQTFEAGGYRFLHIGLQFSPSDRSLRWAASAMRRHSGIPTIVTTHDHLNPAGQQLPQAACDEELVDPTDDNNPATVWRKFLSQHDQIFLVLSGHQSGQARRVDENRFGHQCHQVMANYQDRFQTALDVNFKPSHPRGIGDGWLRLMKFDMGKLTPTITVKTFSTHYQRFSGDIPHYAKWYRRHEQANMTDVEYMASEDFVIPLTDFRMRFDRTGRSTR